MQILLSLPENPVSSFDAVDPDGSTPFFVSGDPHGQIEELTTSHLFLMDAEVWLLSDKAVKIEDSTLGYKLPGAAGGGYLPACAKDESAAARIRDILTKEPPNSKARLVEMSLNNNGFEISRS